MVLTFMKINDVYYDILFNSVERKRGPLSYPVFFDSLHSSLSW